MIAFIGFFSFAPPTFLLKKKSRQKKIKIGRNNPLVCFLWFLFFSVGVGAFDNPKNRQNKRTAEDVGPYKGTQSLLKEKTVLEISKTVRLLTKSIYYEKYSFFCRKHLDNPPRLWYDYFYKMEKFLFSKI